MWNAVGASIRALTLVLLFTAAPCEAGGVRLVTGLEYADAGSGLPDGGTAVELVLAAFDAAGVAVEPIEFLPWKRGYQAVLDGTFDATFPYIQAPGRDQVMLYSVPVYETKVWPLFRSDRVRSYTGPASLAGLALCEPIGWSPPADLQASIDAGSINLIQAGSLQLCARQLLAGRVDLLIASATLYEKIVRPEWHDGLPVVMGDHPVASNRQFLLMARSNPMAPELLARFAAGLETLRSDGRYDAILRRANSL